MDVVARVADEAAPLLVAGQVVRLAGIIDADEELIAIIEVVKERHSSGTSRVDALQIEARCTEVADLINRRVVVQEAAVGGDVVSDELAEKRESSGDALVVGACLRGGITGRIVHHRAGAPESQ